MLSEEKRREYMSLRPAEPEEYIREIAIEDMLKDQEVETLVEVAEYLDGFCQVRSHNSLLRKNCSQCISEAVEAFKLGKKPWKKISMQLKKR